MKRLDLKLAAKDWSPSSSQPPSLSSAPGSAAARTLLKLENDDWTEDELAQVESIPMAQTPRGSEVDLALVAQMMKTTVRKRSPRGVLSLFSFARKNKEKSGRSGSDASALGFARSPASGSAKSKRDSGSDRADSSRLDRHRMDSNGSSSALQSMFTPPPASATSNRAPSLSQLGRSGDSNFSGSHSDGLLESAGSPLSVSGPGLVTSASSISVSKTGKDKKKKGSFLFGSSDKDKDKPEEVPSPTKDSSHSTKKGHRRSSSMVDLAHGVVVDKSLEKDLSAVLIQQALSQSPPPGSSMSAANRTSLSKKEIKELEKREKKQKKAAKELQKAAKRLSKKADKKDKDKKSKSKGLVTPGSSADLVSHRYTTEMKALPSGFDPATLRAALSPSSSRSTTPVKTRPGAGNVLSNSSPTGPTSNMESSTSASELRTGSPLSRSNPVFTQPSELRVTTSPSSREPTPTKIKVNLVTGEVTKDASPIARAFSDPALASSVDRHSAILTVDDLAGHIDEALIKALNSAGGPADKRQSLINLQELASGLGGGFDLGNLEAALLHSTSMGPSDAQSVDSFYSSPNDSSSDDSDSDSDSDDDDNSSSGGHVSSSEADDGELVDDASTTSSHSVVSGFSSSLLYPEHEADADLNIKALESGAQVELVRRIGKGASGTVWFGLLDNRPVAVKQIELREASAKRALEVRAAIKKEVQLLRSLKNTHVIRYFGMFASKAQQQITLIMELVAGLSVTALIMERIKLSERFAAHIIRQVLTGLVFLEENHIIHRDIKPDNLLLNERGVVKIIDFGTAAVIQHQNERRSTVGTPWYCAPEVIRCEEYSYPADIWSIGCTLIEMLTGKPPYDDLQDVACLFKMAEGQTPPLPSHVSPACLSFLQACLTPTPTDRPSAAQLLHHPWLASFLSESDAIADELHLLLQGIFAESRAK